MPPRFCGESTVCLLLGRSSCSTTTAAGSSTTAAGATTATAVARIVSAAQVAARQESDGSDVEIGAIRDAGLGAGIEGEVSRDLTEEVARQSRRGLHNIARTEVRLHVLLDEALDVKGEELKRRKCELQRVDGMTCVVDDDHFARQNREDRNLDRTALDFAEAVRLPSVTEDKAATAFIDLLVRDGDNSGAG